jgi:rubrerythrin
LKQSGLFLPSIPSHEKEFLNLLDLTAKVHGEIRTAVSPEIPFWRETFFNLDKSTFWSFLTSNEKNLILKDLTSLIIQEAYYIEMAGMAYSAKMNLLARTKEEREFYCFVAEEEAKHLRMLEQLAVFDKSPEAIPSFAMLICEIINKASAPASLLLIQILLEGWGLSYYKSLQKETTDEKAADVFRAILKDEIRHHSAGVILFSFYGRLTDQEAEEFNFFLNSILDMVKIGPLRITQALFHGREYSVSEIEIFLHEIEAVKETRLKLELIEGLFRKSLDLQLFSSLCSKVDFHSPGNNEMAKAQIQFLCH